MEPLRHRRAGGGLAGVAGRVDGDLARLGDKALLRVLDLAADRLEVVGVHNRGRCVAWRRREDDPQWGEQPRRHERGQAEFGANGGEVAHEVVADAGDERGGDALRRGRVVDAVGNDVRRLDVRMDGSERHAPLPGHRGRSGDRRHRRTEAGEDGEDHDCAVRPRRPSATGRSPRRSSREPVGAKRVPERGTFAIVGQLGICLLPRNGRCPTLANADVNRSGSAEAPGATGPGVGTGPRRLSCADLRPLRGR